MTNPWFNDSQRYHRRSIKQSGAQGFPCSVSHSFCCPWQDPCPLSKAAIACQTKERNTKYGPGEYHAAVAVLPLSMGCWMHMRSHPILCCFVHAWPLLLEDQERRDGWSLINCQDPTTVDSPLRSLMGDIPTQDLSTMDRCRVCWLVRSCVDCVSIARSLECQCATRDQKHLMCQVCSLCLTVNYWIPISD